MPNKELGIADPVYDALRIRSGQSIAPDLGGGSTGTGGIENKIYVWHADGSTIDLFDLTDVGLTSALTAASSGDAVWMPACTIAGDHTVPAGVSLVGISREKSILTGQLTLLAASIVIGVAIIRSGTSANLTCLVGPGSGAARAVSCKLSVTTTSGTPLAASVSGANTLYLEDCDIAAIKSGSAVTPFAAASETLVDTFSVDSAVNAYQAGTYVTLLSKSYRVEVSGSIQWESPSAVHLADANYTTLDGWSTQVLAVLWRFSDGSAPVSDSGVYESSHVYNFTRPGTGAAFAGKFADTDYTDNSGSFTVNVYEVEQAGVNLEGCVFNGAWLGISEWGDRAARDAFNYPDRHTNDIGSGIHWTQAELDARYASSPGLEWFDVKSYGAVGDGTTDDTTAITAAITAIPTGGGVLYFPAGTYKVTSSLTLSKPITVRGDGSAANLTSTPTPISEIDFTQSTGNLFTVSSHGCSFYDVILFNTSGTTPSGGAGIAVNAGGISARYQNIEVWNFYINIDIQDKQQLWVMDGVLLYGSVKYGLRVANPTTPDGGDWFVSNSSFFSGAYAADAAIRLESSGGGKLTNVKINAAGVTRFVNGIDMAVTAGTVTSILDVSNSSFENISGDGIHLRNTATSEWNQIIVNGVQFGFYTNTGGHAVSIVGVSASHFKDIIIEGCVFRSTGSPGSAIDLQYVDAAYIGTYVNDGFSSLLTTSNTTDIKQIGLGSGTVTSIAAGTGITATPDPIVATGTIAVADTAVTPGSYKTSNITVDQQGRLTAAANGALDDLSDVNAPTPTSGQALIWDTGTSKWIPGTVATTGAINVYNETQTADGTSLTYYLTNYAAPSTIRVYIDGIRQPASDDSAATDVVTFDVAPDAGALLLFDYEMDTA